MGCLKKMLCEMQCYRDTNHFLLGITLQDTTISGQSIAKKQATSCCVNVRAIPTACFAQHNRTIDHYNDHRTSTTIKGQRIAKIQARLRWQKLGEERITTV